MGYYPEDDEEEDFDSDDDIYNVGWERERIGKTERKKNIISGCDNRDDSESIQSVSGGQKSVG